MEFRSGELYRTKDGKGLAVVHEVNMAFRRQVQFLWIEMHPSQLKYKDMGGWYGSQSLKGKPEVHTLVEKVTGTKEQRAKAKILLDLHPRLRTLPAFSGARDTVVAMITGLIYGNRNPMDTMKARIAQEKKHLENLELAFAG